MGVLSAAAESAKGIGREEFDTLLSDSGRHSPWHGRPAHVSGVEEGETFDIESFPKLCAANMGGTPMPREMRIVR